MRRFYTFIKKVRFSPAPPLRFSIYFFICQGLLILWNRGFLLSQKGGVGDWKKEILYYSTLRDALLSGSYPVLFPAIPNDLTYFPVFKYSASYLANPEVLTLSPFMPLLFLSLPIFFKVYIWAHFTVATIGLYFIARHFKFKFHSTLILFSMIVLNPWFMQHIAIGYTPWITACWIPAVIALLLRQQSRSIVWASCVSAFIVYEGGLHVFFWFILALLCFVLFYSLLKKSSHILGNMLFFLSVLAAMISAKIYWIYADFGRWERKAFPSFQSAQDLLGLLTDVTTDIFKTPEAYNIYGTNLYDASLAVGTWWILLSIFVIVAVLWKNRCATSLALVVIIELFVVLSGWGIWSRLVGFFPFLGVEIFPWRFLIVSVMLMSFLMVWQLDKWQVSNRLKPLQTIGFILLVFPILLGFYSRNQLFTSVATQTDIETLKKAIVPEFSKSGP